MLLIIPSKPLSQRRHRHTTSQSGKVWTYDPLARDKVLIRNTIRAAMEKQLPNYVEPEFPLVGFRIYMPIPKSMSKKDKEIAVDERLKHVSKPDVDNILKFYLDCLVGVVLKDDRAVELSGASKVYSDHPRVEIIIEEGERYTRGKNISAYAFPDSVICDSPPIGIKDVPTFRESPTY